MRPQPAGLAAANNSVPSAVSRAVVLAAAVRRTAEERQREWVVARRARGRGHGSHGSGEWAASDRTS